MIAGGAETVETEVLVKHHGWKAGEPLPEIRNDGGCMLAINDCEVAFIGGGDSTGVPSNSIFIYNCKTKQWRTHDATLSKFEQIGYIDCSQSCCLFRYCKIQSSMCAFEESRR